MSIGWKCVAAALTAANLVVASAATADDLETQAKALKIISETATDICNTILQEGSSQSAELSGAVQAKLAGAISKIANLGIEGSGKYNTTEFKGVMQHDLAEAIKSNAECKLNVLKVLQEKMLEHKQSQSTTVPADFLKELRIEKWKRTSVTYVKSLLGTPNFEDEITAQFDRDGYMITVGFYPDNVRAFGTKGEVFGVKVMIDQQTSFDRRATIRFDGVDKRIKPNAVLGTTPLAQFRTDDCNVWYHGTLKSKADVFSYTCEFFTPDGTGGLKFYLDSGDDDLVWKCFALRNYYDKKGLEEEIPTEADAVMKKSLQAELKDLVDVPSGDQVKNFEAELKVQGKTWIDKRGYVADRIYQQTSSFLVSGVQFSNSLGPDLDNEQEMAPFRH
jgi:hypothetical protein